MDSASAAPREIPLRRRHRDDRRHVEGHDGLGVGVVAEEHLAPQPVGGPGYLGAGVPDDVDVHVVPGEREAVVAITGIGVGHRKPAERRPGLLGQRFGADLPV